MKIITNISSFIQNEKIEDSFIFILDQYSDRIELNIKSFLKKIEEYKNIRIILSNTINNDLTKKLVINSIDPYEKGFKIHYFPKLITENEEFDLFFEKEKDKDKYIEKLKEFGGLPIFYFLLKEEEKNNLDEFINYVVKDIIKEINDKDYISIIIDLFALIKSNCLLSSCKLKDILKKIPINYITIKKRDIWFQSQKNFSRPFKYYLNDISIKQDNKTEKEYDFTYDLGNEKKDEIESNNNDINNKDINIINDNVNEINETIKEEKSISISKINSNLLRYYFIVSNEKVSDLINAFYHLEEFPEEIFSQNNFKEHKKISNNIANEFYITNERISPYINTIPKNNKITIYKLEFLYPYMEIIFMKIIYNYIRENQMNLSKLLDLDSTHGLFELIVIYDILTNKKILDLAIQDFITIDSIIPYNYSIKYFSYEKNQKEYDYDYDFEILCCNNINNKRIKIKNKCIFIRQKHFFSKYYDCGILVPDDINDEINEIKNFHLILFQISIPKEPKKRLNEREHEINFFYIKKNLESKYQLNIISGYFYYILRAENNKIIDKDTFNENKNICLSFDIINGFIDEHKKLIDQENLITNTFPFHNVSTLTKGHNNLTLIIKINKMILNKFEMINDELFALLRNYVKNINEKELLQNQFMLIGNESMTDSIKNLTSFFIFIEVKDNINIYINERKLTINNNNKKSNNYCIVSFYKIKFI